MNENLGQPVARISTLTLNDDLEFDGVKVSTLKKWMSEPYTNRLMVFVRNAERLSYSTPLKVVHGKRTLTIDTLCVGVEDTNKETFSFSTKFVMLANPS